MQDITKQTNREVKAAQAEGLKNPRAENKDILSKISHDVRTPMNVVLGITRLLQNPNLPVHKQQELVKALQTSAEHLMHLIDSLLGTLLLHANTSDLERINLEQGTTPKRNFEQEPKKPGRILLVEDSDPNILVATSHLKLFGYSCDIAHNGREAVEMSDKVDYDLILMDVQMPEMDGYEASETIRAREAKGQKAHTPIIGMTACALAGDREKCFLSGMDDYISKPFNAEELKAALENYTRSA